LKGIAIGLSNNSKEILKRLKKPNLSKIYILQVLQKMMEIKMNLFKYKNLEKSYLKNGLR